MFCPILSCQFNFDSDKQAVIINTSRENIESITFPPHMQAFLPQHNSTLLVGYVETENLDWWRTIRLNW